MYKKSFSDRVEEGEPMLVNEENGFLIPYHLNKDFSLEDSKEPLLDPYKNESFDLSNFKKITQSKINHLLITAKYSNLLNILNNILRTEYQDLFNKFELEIYRDLKKEKMYNFAEILISAGKSDAIGYRQNNNIPENTKTLFRPFIINNSNNKLNQVNKNSLIFMPEKNNRIGFGLDIYIDKNAIPSN